MSRLVLTVSQDYNIRTGTAFFASVLKDNGGSLLKTIGNYNGWPSKMTIVRTIDDSFPPAVLIPNIQGSATAAQWSSCCLCQNNLD